MAETEIKEMTSSLDFIDVFHSLHLTLLLLLTNGSFAV